MKKHFVIAFVLVLTATMLTACRNSQGNVGASTDASVATSRVTTVPTTRQETTDMTVADFISKAADEIARRDLTV